MNGVAANDPLDSGSYDPIAHLNDIFSHPSTLPSASITSKTLHSHVAILNGQIGELVARQTVADRTSLRSMKTAQADLQELFDRIEGVRGRAIATEDAITAMTADIKRLDATKRNLTLSMTALKRLQMLTTAYEQLKAQCKSRQYRECAQLLQAVIQLMAHFKSYRSIDQIATLSRSVADLQSQLLEQVCQDFEDVFVKGEVGSRKGMLAEACLVMEALGDSARLRLITWFCNTQLREYRQVFRGNDEAGSLDNIARRYQWLKRILKTYDEEHAPIFPASWKVNEVLAWTYCDGTREDFKGILSRTMRNEPGKQVDVNLLLSCLQETLDLEQFLEKRFANADRVSIDTANSREEKPLIFGKAISEAFEPYLSLWVDSQDKLLGTMITAYRQRPIRPPDEEASPSSVLTSSIEIFQSYRATFAQCAKLSSGSKLKDLSQIFGTNLDKYAEQVLLHYIPDRPNNPPPPLEDIVCILNTADYCHTLCSQLEERIVARIDEDYKSKVSFEKQQDNFMGVANTAIRNLIRKVEIEVEPCWREMRNTPWSKMESVGDQSTYVGELLRILNERAAEMQKGISKDQYKRAFCDRLVDFVANSLLVNLASCKPISEIGAEQMLLDVYSIKKDLEGLITLGSEPATQPSATFTKHVTRSISKVDTILKVIQVQVSPAEGLVRAYLIHIADKSDSNFRKLLDLKGIRKQEQSTLVELFHAHMSAHDNLVDSSPLMAAMNLNMQATGSGIGIAGLGPGNMSLNIPTLGTGTASFTGKLDGFGSALMTGMREGVDRLGTPSLPGTNSTGATTPQPSVGNAEGTTSMNENLSKFGRFFRRDTSKFGS